MDAPVLLSRLMDSAVRKGGRAAEAVFTERRLLTFGRRGGERSDPVEFQECRITGRVYRPGGRVAPLEARLTGPSDLVALLARAEAALDAAIAAADEAPPDPHAAPADKVDIEVRGRALEDRRHATITFADRAELVDCNVAGCAEADPGLVVEGVDYEEELLLRAFASTRGVSASERSTRYRARATARMGDGGRPHHREIAARQFANLAAIPFGYELGKRLSLLHRDARPFDRPVPVLIRPSCTAHLVASLAPAFAAHDVLAGRSFVAGLLGRRLASPLLHVIDDPGLPGALEARSFDDRGVPPNPVVILREGVVAGLYVDPDTARAHALLPTGHAMGGGVRPANLVVRPGGRTRNAIGMDLRDYVVLDNLHRPDPVDPATGRVETLCDCIVFRDHQAEGALRDQPLSMALSDLLGSIVEIAADQGRYGAVDACTLVLRGPVFPG